MSASLIRSRTETSALPVRVVPTDDERLIELWLKGKSRNTAEAYRRDVSDFLSGIDESLGGVRLQHIWDWSDSLTTRGLKQASIARKLAAVKSLLSFAQKTGFLPANVGAAVSLPHVPDLLSERILSEEEIHDLLRGAVEGRDALMLRLFYSSGARVSELAGLKWRAVKRRSLQGSRDTGQISLVGKGSKARSVLLSSATWELLREYRESEQRAGFGSDDDAVFRSPRGGHLSRQTIWRAVKKAAALSGVNMNVSPHWLRHAHASHALDRGAPTHLVKETLGHQSLATTSRYTHARPDDSSGRYLPL